MSDLRKDELRENIGCQMALLGDYYMQLGRRHYEMQNVSIMHDAGLLKGITGCRVEIENLTKQIEKEPTS